MGRRLRIILLFFLLLLWASNTSQLQAAGPCDEPIQNPIVCENSKAGNASSEWSLPATGGNNNIVGFSSSISYNRGTTAIFKIKTDATSYRIDIYRIGYYQGKGARKITSLSLSIVLPQNQPNCLFDSSVNLVDCGNWKTSASWNIPANATSGVYIAKLIRTDAIVGANHIPFIVRDDNSHSDILFQTSDTTWQAYNTYGGYSLYGPDLLNNRAYKVSYNRPTPLLAFFAQEYPMIRFLEANGYNVSYFSGADTDRFGSLLTQHKTFLSIGHDEYWSGKQRQNVENARNNGTNLAFFSGNEVFWKTRWEASIDGANTAYRTLVCYKESYSDHRLDPLANVWTGTWRDSRFSPPADGNRPENALTGTIFMVNYPRNDSIEVPFDDGKMRFWRNTSVANLSPGQKATFAAGTLGYEWDSDLDNGARPPGLIRLSTSNVAITNNTLLIDYGTTFGNGQATHHLTIYKHPSGALVFGAGTVQLQLVLNPSLDGRYASLPPDKRMQQAVINLFADMKAQPSTLISGLTLASKTTDTTAPLTSITAPVNNSSVVVGKDITILGKATDSGGAVGAVEVSVNNGQSWHPANGRGQWQYVWKPQTTGSVTIKARAIDDSGNIQQTPASINVSITPASDLCNSVSITPTQSSSQPQGGSYQFTASSNCGSTGQYRWFIQDPDGTWSMTQDWSSSPFFTWNTSSYNPGNYHVGIWAKKPGSLNTFDATIDLPFILTTGGITTCTSATITPAKPSPGFVNQTYLFTASAVCPVSPEFRWYIKDPGGNWTMAKDWSTANNFSWNTASLIPGSYQVGIWVRNLGSTGSLETSTALDYSLSTGKCSSVTITPNQTSPQPNGGTYSFNASTICDTQASYRWFTRAQNGDWTMTKDWSTEKTFSWNTQGFTPGVYEIGIWAKDASSPVGVSFDSTTEILFTLN